MQFIQWVMAKITEYRVRRAFHQGLKEGLPQELKDKLRKH